MPDLNWAAFSELPGNSRINFERVCRSATWINYSRFGRFAALAQQPGVEFHLHIDKAGCSLGDPGRWYGWQSKFWDLAAGNPIGSTRRHDVLDSIEKTAKYLPGITDWVLWTRHPLTSGDQDWFYGLPSGMELHLWTDAHLDDLLIGDAELLREAYFGKLVLTPERLDVQHKRAAAESGDRWMPPVHQESEAERQLRRMLAEPSAWQDLESVSGELGRFEQAVAKSIGDLDNVLAADVEAILVTSRETAAFLSAAYEQLAQSRPSALFGAGRKAVPTPISAEPVALRRLRALQHPAALPLTNLISLAREAALMIDFVESHVTERLVAVTGAAGYGKTQLAASISCPTETRPAGVLLYGRLLTHHSSLDDIARQMTVGGEPVATFEALLAVVDAAATRSGCRLPVVIDGLNEAEAPTAWGPLLRGLLVTLEKYPSVLVVCTVRESFANVSVPSEVDKKLHLNGFHEDLDEAIDRYFDYFNIERGDADLPLEMLDHPLSLRIYCSVANPDRKQRVSVDRLPGSLTGMFDAYLPACGLRIYELNSSIHPYDVALALDALGEELWQTRQRLVSETRAKELFHDSGGWQISTLAALEREGLVVRQPGTHGAINVALVYDMLAGHVIATKLLKTHGANIDAFLGSEACSTMFAGGDDVRHPLAADIFGALSGKMPRMGSQQLWQVVQEPLRLAALLEAADLEAEYLDSTTVDVLAESIDALSWRDVDIFDRLLVTRSAPLHPLNARFLDRVLRDRTVADRDLRWSEWLRSRATHVRADITSIAALWRQRTERTEADRLRARWMMWILTTTDRVLRDGVTQALYWFGRGDAESLFGLALESARINDPYVGERVIAAAYGVTTTMQVFDPDFLSPLGAYLQGLQEAFSGSSPTSPTSHALIRYYVSSTFEFARRYYSEAVPAEALSSLTPSPGPPIQPLRSDDLRRDDVASTLKIDFRNYTLGRLFPDRGNHDDSHAGHSDATDRLLGVVHTLGWRTEKFADLDRIIADREWRNRNPDKVDRYGKKYGWIGLHTIAGMLMGLLHELVTVSVTRPDGPVWS